VARRGRDTPEHEALITVFPSLDGPRATTTSRADFLHKTGARPVRDHDVIEDLAVRSQ
jgi:hypothetical protein